MYIYNKIVELPSPPNSHDVLWINSNDGQLYVFLNNKWLSLSFTSNEYKLDKYDIKLKTNRKNITDSINELFDIIKDIENHYGDINIEDIAKLQTLLECTATILLYIELLRLQLESTAKLETLTQGINTITDKINNIDLSSLVKEETLTQGINTVSQKIDDIYIPELDKSDIAKEQSLNNGINTLSNKIDNIDLSVVAKESTIVEESQYIKDKIDNIDLTSIENKVDEGVNTLSTKIDNIDLSAVENKVQEESTAIQSKIDNIKIPDVDLSNVAKQGENAEATNTAILYAIKEISNITDEYVSQLHDIIGE